uniref:Uncharacterized protein n=1 Tax=Panagrolaimus superbus TaxID=310955 RepID=A0A914Y959_9BILA
MKNFVYLLLFIITSNVVTGNQEGNRLFEDLMNNYRKLVRPVEKSEDALRIQVKFKLLQIIDVQTKHQVLKTNGWLIQKWNDYRLKWNPKSYGNITMIHIPGELLFLPDICLYNNAHGSPTVHIITKADVYFNGDIIWEPPAVFESVCRIQIDWFPYDIQNCDLKFGSWTYGGYEIDMVHLDSDLIEEINENNNTKWKVKDGIDISEYQEAVEWDLLGVVATRHKKRYPCCDYPVIDITYTINIRRKKLFYTVNLMIPCMGIAALTSFVFYLPCESHQKVTLGISILVALSFFQLLLIEITPPTSLAAPLIGQYLLFEMIMVTLSIILTVIIQNVHWRDEQPMPKIVRLIFVHFLGKYLLIFRNIGNKRFHRQARYKRIPTLNALRILDSHFENIRSQSCHGKRNSLQQQKSLGGLFRNNTDSRADYRRLSESSDGEIIIRKSKRLALPPYILCKLNNVGRNIRYIERSLKKIRQIEDLQRDWQFVAMTIDRLMLIIFSITIFGGTLWATTAAPSLRDERIPINNKGQAPWLIYENEMTF